MLNWVGTFNFYSLGKKIKYNKYGEPIKLKYLGQIKNILVETGKELIADIMTNEISAYYVEVEDNYNIIPKSLAVGTDDTPVTVDDWHLGFEKIRIGLTSSDMMRISNKSNPSFARYKAIIPNIPDSDDPEDNYDIFEIGLFLSDTIPTEDPQVATAQRVNAMISRGVKDSPIYKKAEDSVQIIYDIHF